MALELSMVLITLPVKDLLTASMVRLLELSMRLLLLALLTLMDFLTGPMDLFMVIHRARPMEQDSRR